MNKQEMNKQQIKKEDIQDAFDMLELNMLIYNFTKETPKQLKNISREELPEKRQEVLTSILSQSPHKSLEKFIDLYNGLQCAVTISHAKKRITTIFRGSDSLIDWLYNIWTIKSHLEKDAYIHTGFKHQLLPALELLLEINKRLIIEYPDYQINVTGYSLGAAHSCVFSYHLSKILGDKELKVFTYGSPRVGNKGWKNLYESVKTIKHIRVVNKYDIVSYIPYFWYYHVGHLLELENDGYKYEEDYKEGYNFICYSNPLAHILGRYYEKMKTIIVSFLAEPS